MFRNRLKTILLAFTIFLTLSIIGFAAIIFSLKNQMTEQLEKKQFLKPTTYYSLPPLLKAQSANRADKVRDLLLSHAYRERDFQQKILPGDFFHGKTNEDCLQKWGLTLLETEAEALENCLIYSGKTEAHESSLWLIAFKGEQLTWIKEGSQPRSQLFLDPPFLAQYLGEEPLLQQTVSLGQIPTNCLNAILAIEDQKFLEHNGFSVTSVMRAVFKNLSQGRSAQGGSTITQQLVKNYFLSNEKTFKRKFQELIMAILLEAQLSKDEILETYLNIIYMGQNGSFRIHGYSAAASYYFNQELAQLDLPQCALLAAIVNSPGAFNPWRKPDAAVKRRNQVLAKMKDQDYINENEYVSALNASLPKASTQPMATETAPYFLNAVRQQMKSLNIPIEGTTVYTTLDIQAQQVAQESVQNHLKNLESQNKYIKEQKSKGLYLEGMILSEDNQNGWVTVLVGGRSFKTTQFNRAIDSQRQVGSIMKPLVFLTAFIQSEDYTPARMINDEKFQIRYEGQSWSPENYDKKYYQKVPLFFALKNSLNAATASLGLEIGLDQIIHTAQDLGIKSELKPFPSLTLGAFEMKPIEVLSTYTTFAKMGTHVEPTFILKAVNEQNAEIYRHEPKETQAASRVATAMLVGMMKQTVLSGTAQAISRSGYTIPAAGKTGTTSEYRDTWFAGFTRDRTTVTWVGYDNNTPTKLTGASGAVPIWLSFMKNTQQLDSGLDFDWPLEEVEKKTLDESELQELNAIREGESLSQVELIFRK